MIGAMRLGKNREKGMHQIRRPWCGGQGAANSAKYPSLTKPNESIVVSSDIDLGRRRDTSCHGDDGKEYLRCLNRPERVHQLPCICCEIEIVEEMEGIVAQQLCRAVEC
jgi:hypothetical protein